jgi:hypothetical protein
MNSAVLMSPHKSRDAASHDHQESRYDHHFGRRWRSSLNGIEPLKIRGSNLNLRIVLIPHFASLPGMHEWKTK